MNLNALELVLLSHPNLSPFNLLVHQLFLRHPRLRLLEGHGNKTSHRSMIPLHSHLPCISSKLQTAEKVFLETNLGLIQFSCSLQQQQFIKVLPFTPGGGGGVLDIRELKIEFTQQDGRKKRTAKPLCVTNVTGLLRACFVVIFTEN